MEEIRATPVATDDLEIGVLDFALVLAEKWRMLVFVPLAAGVIALGISLLIPPTFTAVTKVLPPQQQQGLAAVLASQLGALAGVAGATAGIKNPSDIYVAMLQSRTVADRLIERFRLKDLYEAKFDDDARRGLEARSKITAGREGLIEIRVEDQDPKRAADIANAYVEELRRLTQTLAVTEAGQRRLFFEEHLNKSKQALQDSEIALRAGGINEATLNAIPQSALEFIAGLKARVTAQEIKLASMRGFMTESNPELRLVQGELAALRAQLAKAEENSSGRQNGRGADYISRLRDFKYNETLFELMAKQYEIARLDEAREGAVIQVIDPAVAPDFKTRPKRGLIAILMTLAAAFLCFLYLYTRHVLRTARRAPEIDSKLQRLREAFWLRRSAK